MKIAVLGTKPKGSVKGGAENLYTGLVNSLRSQNVDAELVSLEVDETNYMAIKETYLRFYDLDLSDYDGVISTKAPTYMVRHSNHICYLLHTIRVFYDLFDIEFPRVTDVLRSQREFIQKLDTAALQYPRTKKVFVIGAEVADRLQKYNHLNSTVLHPGLLDDNFEEGEFKYVFMPGRLHRWKRGDLIIQAMKYVSSPVKLLISGTGEDENKFKNMARGNSRIAFLGRVSDEELIDLYANALCVPFVPIHEDYGYITIEAFRSGKPVITCRDSGEPANFVKDNVNGFVCDPDPKAIAEKIDFLYTHPEIAKEMGAEGKSSTLHIKWDSVTAELLAALQGTK